MTLSCTKSTRLSSRKILSGQSPRSTMETFLEEGQHQMGGKVRPNPSRQLKKQNTQNENVFFQDDLGEEGVLTANKLTHYLSPRPIILKSFNSNGFWGGEENSKEETHVDETDYGFFVDTSDALDFEPQLILREDMDSSCFTLPPGQEISKIILRTLRMRLRQKMLG